MEMSANMKNLINEYNDRIEKETGVDKEVLSTIWETFQNDMKTGGHDVALRDQERAVRTYVQVMAPAARTISVSTRSNFSKRLAEAVDHYCVYRENAADNDVFYTIRDTLLCDTGDEYEYDDVALREQDLAMRAYARGENPPPRPRRTNLDIAINKAMSWIEHISYC